VKTSETTSNNLHNPETVVNSFRVETGNKKNILIAPLNWGLGHATRCIPIIKDLEEYGFNPIIAGDGNALALLKKEFPHLTALELPSYHIEYPTGGGNLKWKLIKNSPKTLKAVLTEKRLVKKWVSEYNLSGIISDNRLGVYSSKVPSVYITHQLTVLSGRTTWLTSRIHQSFIKKFDQCWIPDLEKGANLSGRMGHCGNSKLKLKHIGLLSRMVRKEIPLRYSLMVLLSGPEPQRTYLEEILIQELKAYEGNVIFIKGKIESQQKVEEVDNITFYNFMQTAQLEQTFNESELVLCRSGYTTIMDLALLEKKAFFIPTPGQYEQEYLAKKLKAAGLASFSLQNNFTIEDLSVVPFYKGLQHFNTQRKQPNMFEIFAKSEMQ